MATERAFLRAQWRNLLMLNYAVEPALLAPLVPHGTILDAHDGATWLSLVAFQFLDTRVMGLRIPLHTAFEEINLRFYVRRELPGEVRRAVVFVREVVPRQAIALVARALYNEPYLALPMRHEIQGDPPHVTYGWKLDGWNTLSAEAREPGGVPPEGSHAAFIAEHYWGYTRQKDGGTLEYRVSHPRWKVWPATLTGTAARLEPLVGTGLARAMMRPPTVFIADGSEVTVYRGLRIA